MPIVDIILMLLDIDLAAGGLFAVAISDSCPWHHRVRDVQADGLLHSPATTRDNDIRRVFLVAPLARCEARLK